MSQTIGYIALVVRDHDEAIAFYTEKPGCRSANRRVREFLSAHRQHADRASVLRISDFGVAEL